MTGAPVPAWLLLSLASMVLVGTADLVLRRATIRGVAPASFLVLQSWFFRSTALFWAIGTRSLRWSPGILWGPVAGVLAFVASYAFLRSLQASGAQVGVNAPIYRLNLAVTAVLAIVFLGERLSGPKAAGLALAVAAVLLLAWALTTGEASAAVPVSQMSFVFTFLLAAPLFREPITPRKLLGLAAAALAILAFYR